MVDTVRLKIEYFKINNPSFFKEIRTKLVPNKESEFRIIKRTNNAFFKEKQKQGIYVPRCWIEEKSFDKENGYLMLEFSVPKLVYGTSYKEVTESDYGVAVRAVVSYLEKIGVDVTFVGVSEAIVTLIAYSKNLDVTNRCSSQQALTLLAPFNYRPRSACNNILNEESNGGSCIKFSSKPTALTIYDKMAEIASNAHTSVEKEIADAWTGQKKRTCPEWINETLRFELTLQNKMSIKQAMKTYSGEKRNSFMFKELFSQKISESLLTKEVQKVFNHPLARVIQLSQLDKPKARVILDRYAHNFAIQSEILNMIHRIETEGLSSVRKDFLKRYTRRTWFRRLKIIKEISKHLNLEEKGNGLNSNQLIKYILDSFNCDAKQIEEYQEHLFEIDLL